MTIRDLRSFVKSSVAILRANQQRRYWGRWAISHWGQGLLGRGWPWLPFEVIDFLGGVSLLHKRVFEFGSGGSTFFWVSQGAQLISIEHDDRWYEVVQSLLLSKGVRCAYRLVRPNPRNDGIELDPANPDQYGSADLSFKNNSFQSYCQTIDSEPDQSFDVVLVDGRARPSCLKHAYRKVKVGGHLILDNSDRAYYLTRTGPYLTQFARKTIWGIAPQSFEFSQTTIFTRMA